MQMQNLLFLNFFFESAKCQQLVALLEVLARKENVAERGPLAIVGELLATLRKKVRNDGESGCAWLYY